MIDNDITQSLPAGTCLRLEPHGGALTVMADHAGWVRVMFSPVAGYWCSMADASAPPDGVAFEVDMSAAAKQARIDAKPAPAARERQTLPGWESGRRGCARHADQPPCTGARSAPARRW